MKRFCLVLAMLWLPVLLLCACNAKEVEEHKARETAEKKMASDFVTNASVHYGELDAEIRLSREDGVCEINMINPESLRDFTFLLKEDVLTLRYKGLSFDIDPSTLPIESMAGMILDTLNQAMEPNGMALSLEGQALVFTGQKENSSFSLRLDKETGNFLSLSIPDEGFSAEFRDFRFASS